MILRRLIVVLVVAAALSGCILAPTIESFKRIGVTKGDRAQLLTERIRDFNEALYWGRPDQALALVAEESQSQMADQLKRMKRVERITESSVDNVMLSEDGYSAEVELSVRFLDIARQTNVVGQRLERQEWRFGTASGWLLVDRAEIS